MLDSIRCTYGLKKRPRAGIVQLIQRLEALHKYTLRMSSHTMGCFVTCPYVHTYSTTLCQAHAMTGRDTLQGNPAQPLTSVLHSSGPSPFVRQTT